MIINFNLWFEISPLEQTEVYLYQVIVNDRLAQLVTAVGTIPQNAPQKVERLIIEGLLRRATGGCALK